MTFNCSMIEPGQPCVMMTGRAFGFFERTQMNLNVDPVDRGHKLR
jgi:hypothetical protein